MSGFDSISYYSPLAVLAIGLLASVSLLALGRRLLLLIAPSLPPQWAIPTSFCLAVLTLSLGVQLLAFSSQASRGALAALLIMMVVAGLLVTPWRGVRTPAVSPLIAIPAIPLTLNLLIAICPSSKIDELYYHMLLPARILADHRLVFYREPWPAAILPHMVYQIGLTPFHALHYPDAGNVLSWFASVLLAWFAWNYVEQRTGNRILACVASVMLTIGLYSTVNHVTSGPHALGDLALTTAILLFTVNEQAAIRPRDHLLGISLLTVTAAATKISLWPVAGILLLVASLRLARQTSELLAVTIPPLLFLGPLMVFSWRSSGSPFGPVLAGIFGSSVYEPQEIAATLEGSHLAGQVGLRELAINTAASYPILLWVAIAAAVFSFRQLGKAERLACVLLFAQAAVVAVSLPWAVRFLGGTHYAVALIGLACLGSATLGVNSLRLSLLSLIPWATVSAYYGSQFVPYPLGLKSNREFHERYVALNRDFNALDRLVPHDAVVLLIGCRCPNYYSSRSVFLDRRDLPPHAHAYLFEVGPTNSAPLSTPPANVFEDSHASVIVYRTPDRLAIDGAVRIAELTPKSGEAREIIHR